MSNLIQRVAAGTAIVAGLAFGAIPQTIKAEKKIEVEYQIGYPFSNIINEQAVMRINKADTVVERYTPQYTGDAGVGAMIEDSIDIILGGNPGNSRCINYNSSGNVIGTRFIGRIVAPSRIAFELVMKEMDADKDSHVSIKEANDYRIKSIVRHSGSYSNCKD